MDLSAYKITLPIAADCKLEGHALELQGPAIAEGADYFWLKNTPTEAIFRCPDGGASTPTSNNCRSELRHLTDYAYTQSSFINITSKIISAKPGKNLTLAQMHGGSSSVCKVNYKDGQIRAFVRPHDGGQETKILMATSVVMNTDIQIGLAYVPGSLAIVVNGYTVNVELERTGTYFWKWGAYPADTDETGFVYEVRVR